MKHFKMKETLRALVIMGMKYFIHNIIIQHNLYMETQIQKLAQSYQRIKERSTHCV